MIIISVLLISDEIHVKLDLRIDLQNLNFELLHYTVAPGHRRSEICLDRSKVFGSILKCKTVNVCPHLVLISLYEANVKIRSENILF